MPHTAPHPIRSAAAADLPEALALLTTVALPASAVVMRLRI